MNRFFVVALMATCFAANAALETIPLTTNESGRVGWEIGLARSNINEMVELIPELDSKIGSTSNTMAAAIALKQDALPQAGHGELLYSLFGFPAWLDGASSYAIMMHNGTTVNWLDKPAGETGSGLLAFGQTNGLHWTGNGYPYSFNGEVAARMKIPASDLSIDYEDGFYGLTVQNGEISFGEIQDPETITNDWSEVIAAIPVGDPNALSGNLLVTSTAPLTLVVSNGLVYAVLPNGDMVDVTYYLPAYAVTEPTTNYPAGFAAFDFVASTTNVSASAPQIAEWTRQNQPGDTMALTAENLDPTNALFVFSDGSEVLPGDIIALDDRQCAVTLPDGLASNAFYLAWPYNSEGFGEPVGINQAEAWWVGPDVVWAGQTFSIFGQNLTLDGTNSYAYLDGYGWLSTTNCNPYKADFTLPAGLENGLYTIYAHNGHGGKYGWSAGVNLEVVAASPVPLWNTDSNTWLNILNYGASRDGTTDDSGAFDAMIAASASNDTLYLPAGTYAIGDDISLKDGTRLLGEGMDATIVKPTPAATLNTAFFFSNDGFDYVTIEGIEFNCGTNVINFGRNFFHIRGSDYTSFINCRFNQEPWPDHTTTSSPIDIHDAQNIINSGCEYIIGGQYFIGAASRVTFGGCTFKGINDANTMLAPWGADMLVITNCTASNYDDSNEDVANGWAKGRLISGNGIWGPMAHYYAKGNSTVDFDPRSGLVDQNQGEDWMFEGADLKFIGKPDSVTSNTVVFGGISTAYGQVIVVVKDGRGQGQSVLGNAASNGVVTINGTWKVAPDTNSIVGLQYAPYRHVLYNNNFDGRYRTVTNTTHTASAGIEFYGASYKSITANNTFSDMRCALAPFVLNSDPVGTTNAYNDQYFNLYANNTITNCRVAVALNIRTYTTGDYGYGGFLGDVFRGNTSTNGYLDAVDFVGSGISLGSAIFDKNTFESQNGIMDTGINTSFDSMVFSGNSFVGIGTGVGDLNGSLPALINNTLYGFETKYETHYGKISIPKRTVLIDEDIALIPIVGAGTTQSTFTAATSSDWLVLGATNGSVGVAGATNIPAWSPVPQEIGESATVDIVIDSGRGVPGYISFNGDTSYFSTGVTPNKNIKVVALIRVDPTVVNNYADMYFGYKATTPHYGMGAYTGTPLQLIKALYSNTHTTVGYPSGDWQLFSYAPLDLVASVDGSTANITTNVATTGVIEVGRSGSGAYCKFDLAWMKIYEWTGSEYVVIRDYDADFVVGSTLIDGSGTTNATLYNCNVVPEIPGISTNTFTVIYGDELGVE